jgi:transposase-like protein
MRVLAQELMELEVAEHINAERHERTTERSGYRNGHRERPWDTRAGTSNCRHPNPYLIPDT